MDLGEVLMKFKGTKDDWDKWVIKWRKDLGLCDDFKCVHELMSCGIFIRCGDCSSYDYQCREGCDVICKSADCMDCFKFRECKKPKTLIDPETNKRIKAKR